MGKYEEALKARGGSPWMVDRGRALDLFNMNQTGELYNQLLNKASAQVGIDPSKMEEFMNIIIYHESDRTMDPTLIHPNAGRGLFGYEISEASDFDNQYEFASGSARTAMNRLYAQIGGRLTTNTPGKVPMNIPEFMKSYFEGTNIAGDVDASQLTEEQQKLLFLADNLESTEGAFTGMGAFLIRNGGHEEYAQWWGQYHQKGSDPDVDIFMGNIKQYLRDKNNQ